MAYVSQSVRNSDRENFSLPNYRKFAVECDSNSKIFQNVRKLDFLKNYIGFSRNIAVECVSDYIISLKFFPPQLRVLSQKSEKF